MKMTDPKIDFTDPTFLKIRNVVMAVLFAAICVGLLWGATGIFSWGIALFVLIAAVIAALLVNGTIQG